MLQQIINFTDKIQEQTEEVNDLYKLIRINLQSLRILINSNKAKLFLDRIISKGSLLNEIQDIQNEINELNCKLLIVSQITAQQKNLRIERLKQYQDAIEATYENVKGKQNTIAKLTKPIPQNAFNRKVMLEGLQKISVQNRKNLLLSTNQYIKINRYLEEGLQNLKMNKDKLLLKKLKIQQGTKNLMYATTKHTNYTHFLNNSNKFIEELQQFRTKQSYLLQFDELDSKMKSENTSSELSDLKNNNYKMLQKLKQQKQLTLYLEKQHQRLVNEYCDKKNIKNPNPQSKHKNRQLPIQQDKDDVLTTKSL